MNEKLKLKLNHINKNNFYHCNQQLVNYLLVVDVVDIDFFCRNASSFALDDRAKLLDELSLSKINIKYVKLMI